MRTLLDRSVVAILPEESASRRQGVEVSVERLHVLHGTSLIYDACQLLDVETSTYATACQLFHMFFQQRSFLEYDVWSTSMASVLLATKIEEDVRSMKQVIKVYSHIYRKRATIADLESKEACLLRELPFVSCLRASSMLSSSEKMSRLKALPPSSQFEFGPVFEEWRSSISSMEQVILRQLGFT